MSALLVPIELRFCSCFSRFFKLADALFAICMLFVCVFNVCSYRLLCDCILHMFSRAILQVRRSNTQTVHFPRVFSSKNSVVRRLILYVFCRIFLRLRRFLYHSAYSIQHQFWFLFVFLMFLTLFVNTQREPLCEYVFNRCAEVFIFLRFSKPRRRIAHVFSYFLSVGWPRLAELGGWPGLAELGSSGIILHAVSCVFVAKAYKTYAFSYIYTINTQGKTTKNQ